MILSMTGFGEASGTHEGVHYSVEVRSLNNKYFKPTVRISDDLAAVEPRIESALRERLYRGSVVVTVNASALTGKAALEVNHEALSKYIAQLRESPDFGSGQLQIQLAPLLTLPGVLNRPAEDEETMSEVHAFLLDLLGKALDELLEMRHAEGVKLRNDLMSQHASIDERLARVADRAPDVVSDYQNRLHDRVNKLLEELGRVIEPADLIKEVAIFAERSDIAEEITRLGAHLEQFKELVARDDGKPVGRTLDFLTQEMLREANTIASKSSDGDISKDIVEIKGAIDRIKEQVQNVE